MVRKSLAIAAIVVVCAGLCGLAGRVQLSIWGGPITLDGRDMIYVQHGFRTSAAELAESGYATFRKYVEATLSFELFVDGEQIEPTSLRVRRYGRNIEHPLLGTGFWGCHWVFMFMPGVLSEGEHIFEGIYTVEEWPEPIHAMRVVTIEY